MTNTHNSPREETDFVNDQFTDIVLHKDDEPVVQNGEIINEPDDVEERSVAVQDAAMFPQKNSDSSSSCWFPIHFTYKGVDHTADVQRVKAPLSEEYHVSGIIPSIDHLPDPFIVAEHFSKEKFDFPVNEEYYPVAFGDRIVSAIRDGSNHNRKE